MIRKRISALSFLLCLSLFSVGTIFSLPPVSKDWEITKPEFSALINGKATLEAEKQIEDNLSYKDYAVNLWGIIRYGIFSTGSEGVIIGKDDWLFTKEEFETTDNFLEIVEDNISHIRKNISILKQHNLDAIIIWIPEKSRIHSDKLGMYKHPNLHKNLSPPNGLPLIDGNIIFSNLSNDAFMRTDTHWSTYAAKATAHAVKNYIATNLPDLELTNKSFITTVSSINKYSGDLSNFVPTGWLKNTIGVGDENVTPYKTEPANSNNSIGLFGEEQIDVTLIGTSYSAQKDWHFDGFLKQELQADILNLADEGQGPFKPMDSFIERLQKGEINTKLVIWEFPERYLTQKYLENNNTNSKEDNK